MAYINGKEILFSAEVISDEVTYALAYEKGKQAEHDAFWDEFQSRGARTDYNNAFSGQGWTDKLFGGHKYPIKPTTSVNMFENSKVTQVLDVDFSNTVNASSTFNDCRYLQRVGKIDLLKSTAHTKFFRRCYNLTTIDEITFPLGANFFEFFRECRKLRNITISGEISGTSLDFSYSQLLTKQSIINIINALAKAGSSTIILPAAAIEREFTDAEWAALIGTKTGWTFALMAEE